MGSLSPASFAVMFSFGVMFISNGLALKKESSWHWDFLREAPVLMIGVLHWTNRRINNHVIADPGSIITR